MLSRRLGLSRSDGEAGDEGGEVKAEAGGVKCVCVCAYRLHRLLYNTESLSHNHSRFCHSDRPLLPGRLAAPVEQSPSKWPAIEKL